MTSKLKGAPSNIFELLSDDADDADANFNKAAKKEKKEAAPEAAEKKKGKTAATPGGAKKGAKNQPAGGGKIRPTDNINAGAKGNKNTTGQQADKNQQRNNQGQGYNQGGYNQGYNNQDRGQGQGYYNQDRNQGYYNKDRGQGYNNQERGQGQGYYNRDRGQGYNNQGQGYNNQDRGQGYNQDRSQGYYNQDRGQGYYSQGQGQTQGYRNTRPNENQPPRQRQQNFVGSPLLEGDDRPRKTDQRFKEHVKPKRGREYDRRPGTGRDPTEMKKGGTGKANWGGNEDSVQTNFDDEWTDTVNADDTDISPKVDKKVPDTDDSGEPKKDGAADPKKPPIIEQTLDVFYEIQQKKKDELQKLLGEGGNQRREVAQAAPASGKLDWSKLKPRQTKKGEEAPSSEFLSKTKESAPEEKHKETKEKKGPRSVAVDKVFNVRLPPRPRIGRGRGVPGREDEEPEAAERGLASPSQAVGAGRGRGRGNGGPRTPQRRTKQMTSKEFDATNEHMFPTLGERPV